MIQVMHCGECKWWRFHMLVNEDTKQRLGKCHRHPPQISPTDGYIDAKFPVVLDTEFCGDWTSPVPFAR